jgi:hypothetical protein
MKKISVRGWDRPVGVAWDALTVADQESRSAVTEPHLGWPPWTSPVHASLPGTTTHDSGGTLTGSSTQGIRTVLHPVSDLATAKVGGGRLVATVTDPDGNVLGLLQDR